MACMAVCFFSQVQPLGLNRGVPIVAWEVVCSVRDGVSQTIISLMADRTQF